LVLVLSTTSVHKYHFDGNLAKIQECYISPDILSTKKKTIKSEHYTKDVYDAYIFYGKKLYTQ